jgi:hypothetical protein
MPLKLTPAKPHTYTRARCMQGYINTCARLPNPLQLTQGQPASIDVFRPPARLDMHTRITSSHRGRRLRPKPYHARPHSNRRTPAHGGARPGGRADGRKDQLDNRHYDNLHEPQADRRATP